MHTRNYIILCLIALLLTACGGGPSPQMETGIAFVDVADTVFLIHTQGREIAVHHATNFKVTSRESLAAPVTALQAVSNQLYFGTADGHVFVYSYGVQRWATKEEKVPLQAMVKRKRLLGEFKKTVLSVAHQSAFQLVVLQGGGAVVLDNQWKMLRPVKGDFRSGAVRPGGFVLHRKDSVLEYYDLYSAQPGLRFPNVVSYVMIERTLFMTHPDGTTTYHDFTSNNQRPLRAVSMPHKNTIRGLWTSQACDFLAGIAHNRPNGNNKKTVSTAVLFNRRNGKIVMFSFPGKRLQALRVGVNRPLLAALLPDSIRVRDLGHVTYQVLADIPLQQKDRPQ